MLPSWTWSEPPSNHLDLIRIYDKQIRDAYARGEYEPLVWPYRMWGFHVVLAYLLLPPTQSKAVHYAKYPVFAYFVWWSYRCFHETRSIHLHGNYGIGLINMWSVIWLAALMIFSDKRADAQVIERRQVAPSLANGHGSGKVAGTATGTALQAQDQNPAQELRVPSSKPSEANASSLEPESRIHYNYTWQPLPPTLRKRLLWMYHLVTSFRGAGWNWATPGILPPPPHVLATLPSSPLPKAHQTSAPRHIYPTRRQVLFRDLRSFTTSYILIDAFKTFALRDPYFWGFIDGPPPSSIPLPHYILTTPSLAQAYRLFVSLVGVFSALAFVFALNGIIYCCTIGPSTALRGETLLGALGEPWLYAPFSGHVRILYTEGLAGWWGKWWHQIFRVGFQEPTRWLLERLGWSAKSGKGKALGALVAFGLSASVHAAGSATSWPQTRPWGPAGFFLLQGVGVGLEMGAAVLAKRTGLKQRLPGVVKKVLTGAWVVMWMYWTAGRLTEDFGRSGVWLFEPVPISLFRGLGYGLPEEGWWCWHGTMVFWHTGEKWWKSGIAL
jgi:hypothetical protein